MKRGGVPHRILSVACAAPQTADALLDRMDARYGATLTTHTAVKRALWGMANAGLLTVAEQGGGRRPSLYVLAPAGELLLDQLWGDA